jgi:hypothetical protein
MLVVSTAVPATRVGDAAHGILRKHSGDCTKAEERGECKSERDFHDVGSVIRLRTSQPMHLSYMAFPRTTMRGFRTAHPLTIQQSDVNTEITKSGRTDNGGAIA